MANLTPLLRDINGVYSDRARDRLPNGSVWELVDWVPMILQAGARMRGAWTFQSPVLAAVPDGMLYAPFKTGSRLLVANGTALHDVDTGSVAATNIGAIPQTRQNPIFHRNRVVIPASDGVTAAKFVVFNGTVFTLSDAPASALTGRYATVWKDRVIIGNTNAQPQQLAFCKPGDPTVAWDPISIVNTSYDLTGLAAQRTQVLCFHASSVERLRGTTPPDSTLSDPTGDLLLDTLFDRAGCYDARSIATWNDNVVFCDARGIHLTDGAVVRNMAKQGGIINLYRASFERGGNAPLTIAGVVHQDYYICTLRHTALPPLTFVVDLSTRRAFQISNVDATAFAYSIGVGEKLYGADAATMKATDLTPMFDPDNTVLQVDGDGTPVLPTISTGWNQLTREPGFKRVKEMHLSYMAQRDDDQEVLRASYIGTPTSDPVVLGEFRPSTRFDRRKLPVRKRLEGFGVKLDQLLATKDSRLYDISVWMFPEEATRT